MIFFARPPYPLISFLDFQPVNLGDLLVMKVRCKIRLNGRQAFQQVLDAQLSNLHNKTNNCSNRSFLLSFLPNFIQTVSYFNFGYLRRSTKSFLIFCLS